MDLPDLFYHIRPVVLLNDPHNDFTKLPGHVVTKVEEHVAPNDKKKRRGEALLFAPHADHDVDEDTDVDDDEPEDDDHVQPSDG